METNPSAFGSGDSYPVENVSWNDAQEFIARLNQKSGRNKYRLPTEAEWEYAARSGGKEEKYAGFSAENEIFEYGNFCDLNCELDWKETGQNDGYKNTAPVGSFAPNGLGLHDMTGNVWEWVSDIYYKYAYNVYAKEGISVVNPLYESSGANRVLRGGSCASPLQNLRTSYRNGDRNSSVRYNDAGFRVVMIPESVDTVTFYRE
jgi:formylglycine-generating enzyme required for sulfatase activity